MDGWCFSALLGLIEGRLEGEKYRGGAEGSRRVGSGTGRDWTKHCWLFLYPARGCERGWTRCDRHDGLSLGVLLVAPSVPLAPKDRTGPIGTLSSAPNTANGINAI